MWSTLSLSIVLIMRACPRFPQCALCMCMCGGGGGGVARRRALELGVELIDDAPKVGPAAIAMWLFDGSVEALPGGYDISEISPNSPVKVLKSFPQV